jgi:hypothetical protein
MLQEDLSSPLGAQLLAQSKIITQVLANRTLKKNKLFLLLTVLL